MSFKSSFTIPAVAAISFYLIGGTSPAYADLGDQLFKLLADDGAAEDSFGVSVAISGAIAIVGATLDDDNGIDSGSAYLFDTTTGRQIAKLVSIDNAAGDRFGVSVAISGAMAIVGAYWDDDNGNYSGSAYLFDTTTGQQLSKLLADDGYWLDEFGISVAISGATCIVGARSHDANGGNAGAAYLFDTTTGKQIAKLLPKDAAGADWFGTSVAISGAIAIVGAPWNDDNGSKTGSAYLFDISDPANPSETAKLLASDGAAGDEFGISVAISGLAENQVVIVGAYRDDDNGANSGSAYLFDISDPVKPSQIAKLLAGGGTADDRFGWSVGISGETAIVGAYSDDDNGDGSGSAYLFDTATGRQIAKLLPSDGAEADFFGFSVAISGGIGKEVAIVGAFADDDNSLNSGSAYLFDAAAAPACPWDLDDSGSVGASDLLSLLVTWGPCKDCPADFDYSGNVGAYDLLQLLVHWGPCP